MRTPSTDPDSFAADYRAARRGERAAFERLVRGLCGDLERFVRRLKPAFAGVPRCRLLRGVSPAATAAEHGLTTENVNKRLVRARGEIERLAATWARAECGEGQR